MTRVLTPDIAKGRGRPPLASQGLSPKRSYTRFVTPEMMEIRRLGEQIWGRNWKVDLAEATDLEIGVVTRFLAGTRAIPDDMPVRLQRACAGQIAKVNAALSNSLLSTSEPMAVQEHSDELARIGIATWGAYWRSDFARAVGADLGLFSNAMSGKRRLAIDPAKLREAVKMRLNTLQAVARDPYFNPSPSRA